ncbi:MAG: hypothetical protein KDA68_07075 [Planctomycetaceae bacterium]|nr:hypothetical protein [Planctomycetaceae bacterium]
MFKSIHFSWVIALCILLQADLCEASPELRDKLLGVAETILKVTKNEPVTVGVFSPTGLPDSNSGPGFEGALTDALNQISKGSVSPEAKIEIKGDYAYAKSQNPLSSGLKVIKLKVRIIDKEFAQDLADFDPIEVLLDGTNTIAEIVQITARIDPDGSKQSRNEELDQSFLAPKVHIHGPKGTLISSSPESPYAVEILTKSSHADQEESTPRIATVAKGMSFVPIERDQLYEVKIYNRSKSPVAVSLFVDGVDVFHFADSESRTADGKPSYSHFIVQPADTTGINGEKSDGTLTIVGWFQKLNPPDNYLAFRVTEHGQGAVTKSGIKSRGQVGVIHLQFSECYPLRDGAFPRSGNETGFGPPRSVKQQAVRFEIEPPHDFVSIRYNRD